MTDRDSAVAILEKHSLDVVIHCAGIAHQKIGAVDSATYMRVNSEPAENLEKAAARDNPMIEIPYPFPPKALLGKLFSFAPMKYPSILLSYLSHHYFNLNSG